MKKEILEQYIKDKLTLRGMSKESKKSVSTVRYWLSEYGLKTHKAANKILPHLCKCGETNPDNFYGKMKQTCKPCFSIERCKDFVDKKIKAIEYKGGACSRCGYDRYYGSLEFHHRDPNNKELVWDDMRKTTWDNITVELDKCDLVCGNCHSEIHGGIID